MDGFHPTQPHLDSIDGAGPVHRYQARETLDPGTANRATTTGTTIVGLTTADATVLAADRRASAGGRFVTSKRMQKIEPVGSTAALAMSGSVSHLQRFVSQLRAESALYADRRGQEPSITALATLAGNVLRAQPLYASPILGGVDDDGPQVFQVGGDGATLSAPYAAAGSGMQLAYGVLEREYDRSLPVEEATEVAGRAIESAAERDTASGNGITIAVVDDADVDLTEAESLEAWMDDA